MFMVNLGAMPKMTFLLDFDNHELKLNSVITCGVSLHFKMCGWGRERSGWEVCGSGRERSGRFPRIAVN